jgi:16S rRNA (guanine527-N7)-methyltransferase
MPTLSNRDISRLIEPYLPQAEDSLAGKLSLYLDLLIKWSGHTNLTAIRKPEDIVRRHFGESLFAGRHLPQAQTMLDFGSGAGFPGLPIQLLLPKMQVTLGESQNKKAGFLREAIRTLGVGTEVWADRIESMSPGRKFDVVAMRAVDNMPLALIEAAARSAKYLLVSSTLSSPQIVLGGFVTDETIKMPASQDQILILLRRIPS